MVDKLDVGSNYDFCFGICCRVREMWGIEELVNGGDKMVSF